MTNDSDFELWAAMMADDEPVVPVAVATVQVTPVTPEPVIAAPAAAIVEEVPVVEAAAPEVVEIEPIDEDTLGFSDLAKSTISEPASRSAEFFPAVEDLDSDDELDFPTALFKEPQTNSINIAQVPDALTSDIVTESGEVLKTGAIDLPLLNNTGSIPIITLVPETIDEAAINADMGDPTTAGIPPIRAGSVMNSSAKVGVLPIKNRRSEGQVILLATSSILLVTLGAGVLALYMLEIIS
jgi:hypothetical protein